MFLWLLLNVPHLVILSSSCYQLSVCATLNDLPVLEDNDVVSVLDGGESVRHDHAGPVLAHLGQSRLNVLLGGGVQAAGGLVQEDEPG